MKLQHETLYLSATDLARSLGCEHLTQLDLRCARGEIPKPRGRDPRADLLAERGMAHERAYLDRLLADSGGDLLNLDGAPLDETGLGRTREALASGVAVVAQAPLVRDRWRGRADVLVRVERASRLGPWSYRVEDTKLASETRGGTILQLCLYTDILGDLQGLPPDEMAVVTPRCLDAPERYPTADYMAYYRLVRDQLEATIDAGPASGATYPEPVDECDTCRWWHSCKEQRRKDDHLCLVAGVTRLHRAELGERGITTLTGLAKARLPLDPKPKRGNPESYERGHAQADIQLRSRGREMPLYEALPIEFPGIGLTRLPEPSPGDVFLDLEGDPFVDQGGLEYLFGWVTIEPDGTPRYHQRWAHDRAEERVAFEAFIDDVMNRWAGDSDLHVYHFHSYETGAMKRLMGRYGTREQELDQLLRGERFIDLYAVARQGIRAGIEGYGLKDLEPVHGFRRDLPLDDARAPLRAVERALELGQAEEITPGDREKVVSYNRDDCMSTLRLRDWLEGVRAEQLASGVEIPRPETKDGDPSSDVEELDAELQAVFDELSSGIPEDRASRSDEEQGRWLMANLLGWHRREDKAHWWEFYRLASLPPHELRDEKMGLADLEYIERVGGTERAPVDRYRFPRQEHDVRAGHTLRTDAKTKIGKVEAIDRAGNTMDIKKRGDARDVHPSAVFADDYVNPGPIPQAVLRLARWVAEHGADADGEHRAARDLLLGRPPRGISCEGDQLRRPGEDPVDAARRFARQLDHGVLAVQGPPGTGKTHTGARMICELVRQGRRVGVTALSHKVITNLLEEVLRAAKEVPDFELTCGQKVRRARDEPLQGLVEFTKSNDELDAALASGTVQVAGGTAWYWSRDAAVDSVDVLVVDEAGQVSLAGALAVAQAARSIVLLGDPQQLEQPIQGCHPDGCDVSALDHLLQGHDTLPEDRGLFLPETWRLHPTLAAYTSELFYEGRLESHAGCERQALEGVPGLEGAGLWLASVEHEGNTTSSPEEVEQVAAIVQALTSEGSRWINAEGVREAIGLSDVLIVSPYNLQVAALAERLPDCRVGTVDKFQGQQAPVVIYSMAASSVEDAPRGMEFLFSLNRLNVATSRARCGCVLVASPRVLQPMCRAPWEMRLANALARYRECANELATVI